MNEDKRIFAPIHPPLQPAEQAVGARILRRGRSSDDFSPEEAAARADAVAKRLTVRKARQLERYLVPLGAVSAEAEAMREAGRRPFTRLAIVIIAGTAVMLFSTWLATLGWPLNPLPHPQAMRHKN